MGHIAKECTWRPWHLSLTNIYRNTPKDWKKFKNNCNNNVGIIFIIRGILNSWARPSTKTTKIGSPRIKSISQYAKYSYLWNTNAPLPQHIKKRLDLWPTDLVINRDHLLIKDYLPTKFEASGAKRSWVISCTRYRRSTWPLTLTFDLNINRDHLLIKDYLPTKFEGSEAKCSWVISCTRLRGTDIPTDGPTDMCNAICPPFSKGGITDGPTDMCHAIRPPISKGGIINNYTNNGYKITLIDLHFYILGIDWRLCSNKLLPALTLYMRSFSEPFGDNGSMTTINFWSIIKSKSDTGKMYGCCKNEEHD